MPTVEEVHSKVQRLLQANLNRIEIDKDNDFILRYESAIVYVSVKPGFGDDGVIIRVWCPLVVDVPITFELCRWIAVEGQCYKMGRAWLNPSEDETTGWIYFGHSMIGDDLDESELMGAIYAVTYTSDDLDNELRDKFGGELFGPES